MNKYKLELTETQLQIINDALEEYFRIPLNQWEVAGKILWGYSIPHKDKTQLVAEDIWQVIRHQLYLDSGITNTWRVDSRIPIQWGPEPMPKIEKIKKESESE